MDAASTRSANGRWVWYDADDAARAGNGTAGKGDDSLRSELREWLEQGRIADRNRVRTAAYDEGAPRLHGTLVLVSDPRDEETKHGLRYLATNGELVTAGLSRFFIGTMREERFRTRLLASETPIDALLFVLSLAVERYFDWMDRFERQLTRAKSQMRDTNGGHLFQFIMDLRYDLLHWNAQLIPLNEIRFAAEETFRDARSGEAFSVYRLRLERAQMLQDEYESEIDSLLKLDEMTINYRSNDIMKTLTVFTVLLTPMTALGAIWGMNFSYMPETDWKWGYFASLAVIFLFMGVIYWYLKRQGWTENLLRAKARDRP
ncbi:magnesium transporter CorA family protein [Paenibacillus sp.]|uniref:magnesium transporter CorA family protein n=1 Tax=Paenibacillus sp. TaxID=58172 RepID=UPI002D49DFD5|nr:magnesium transporter CorA family protein [Paenibacillus sp.]HZG88210.1 magnesium transporter CorA family protein [Paenibacillus sp.]